MTAEQLRSFKNKTPFKPFKIHMADGTAFDIKDPEFLVIHPDWSVDATVLLPAWSFLVHLPEECDTRHWRRHLTAVQGPAGEEG